jgi:YVTN family beta-propeller protein
LRPEAVDETTPRTIRHGDTEKQRQLFLCVSMSLWLVAALCGDGQAAQAQAQHADPESTNIYAATGRDALAPMALRARPLVYVPNSRSASVTVIDPLTYRVVRTFSTGALPQHVVPSYDLGTLWVANNDGNSLTPIDPETGQDGVRVAVDDP